ncbi:two-component sensor histidine kinase [Actinomadura craniellae]|uniref:histidine kinase n=1 Tax=Actinomadura craniellae TaxID=2231787 RepID=A0A365GWR9_9ACTN|nr:ATP-binding protein [Actinomadura craniellae]RAY11256.1 two-component sensor histidine kinase [Actinomadura craniellae]
MRLRPRSIRARDTMLAALISATVLSLLAVAFDPLIRSAVSSDLLAEVQNAARRASQAERDGTLPARIRADGRVALIQVVTPDGRVVKATAAAAGRAPVSTLRPPAAVRVQDRIDCGGPDRCLVIEAIRTTTAHDAPTVYAAAELPVLMVPGLLELLLLLGVVLLAVPITVFTWYRVGRTLRPIGEIEAQLAEISGSDLSRRVPEPPGEDEIARLARTSNATLERLERAVTRQRQFAADASHELRTPIAGLRVNLEDALMHPDDTDLVATVRAALRDTDRLEAIITDLLLLARLGTGTAVYEPVALTELVAAERARRAVRRMDWELAAGLVVRGVPTQLVRLLTNLLDNAERHAESAIDVRLRRDGGHAVLTVADDGAGIPEADRERVFERFTRLDSARSRDSGGTGLGLAIARDIAVAHGGSLHIADAPRGARFVLRLPAE